MAGKRTNLQSVIERQAKGPVSEPTAADEIPKTTRSPKQPSRVGKVNITGYFAPAVKSSFRMIQSKHPDKTIQDLLAEALDDLFAKYNVPQTAQLEK